jgi:hypothetical protein
MALVGVHPILGSKGHQLLPPNPEKTSVSHYNKDVCLNLLPCWLGFVDWVGAPLHPNSLFGVGHFCGPFAVVVPVLSSSDSWFDFLMIFQAEILTPQQVLQA